MRIRFRLWRDGNPINPTVRHRGLRVIEELQRRDMDAAAWTGMDDTSDVLILQRAIAPNTFEAIRPTAGLLLLDVNDDIYSRGRDVRGLGRVVEKVDGILTSSEWLAQVMGRFNSWTRYWPEAVDSLYLNAQARYGNQVYGVRIAWMGMGDNLVWFERSPIYWALRDLATRYSLHWIISLPETSSTGESNVECANSLLPGVVDWHKWTMEGIADLMASCDVAVVPLEQSQWCWCKAASKAAIFMAIGLPTVAERVPPYEDAIEDGETGFLCYHEEDWYEALERLITEPALRRQIGEAGRESARRQYSVERVANALLEHIEELVRTH